MNRLQTYGWDDSRVAEWQELPHEGLVPARVVVDHGQHYRIVIPEERTAQLSGTLAHKLRSVDMPKIGDWVAVQIHADDSATIQAVLSRTSEIVRGHVGRLVDKQVVAANVDVAFIIQPLDHDFSVERLERYIFQLTSQRIKPIILLNKADTATDALEKQSQLAGLGAKTIIMSAKTDISMAAVEAYIVPGQTVVILGSSGAGKSTLTNRLLGEDRQKTAAIREKDSKGRHTTVHREPFLLPGGGMIIDTPGIRELQLWGNIDDLHESFPDIAQIITLCRFNNCSHGNEDGCAIQQGVSDGTLDPQRYKTYVNFKQELEALETRRNFIDERRSQQSKESAKRRRRREMEK